MTRHTIQLLKHNDDENEYHCEYQELSHFDTQNMSTFLVDDIINAHRRYSFHIIGQNAAVQSAQSVGSCDRSKDTGHGHRPTDWCRCLQSGAHQCQRVRHQLTQRRSHHAASQKNHLQINKLINYWNSNTG